MSAVTVSGPIEGYAEFIERLRVLRVNSGLSYADIGRRIGRPKSTVNGWIIGRNLPYPRHDHSFATMLELFGVDDTAPWIRTLRQLRSGGVEPERTNPYLGLRSFTESDAYRFFGRTAETAWLQLAVTDFDGSDVILVTGASGAGKTSLLRAGLVAAIDKSRSLEAIYASASHESLDWLLNLRGRLAERRMPRTVAVVDQLERIFSASDPELRAHVLESLEWLSRLADVCLVVAVRSDLYGPMTEIGWLRQAAQTKQLVLGPLDRSSLVDVIVEPARSSGITVAPDLLVELFAEFDQQMRQSSSGGLPMLSHVLFRLAEQRRDTVLTVADYRRTGGLANAMDGTASAVMASLTAEQRTLAEGAFLALLRIVEDQRVAAAPRTLREIEVLTDLPDRPAGSLAEVIERFAAERILTLDGERIVLSHEALIDGWSWLHNIVEGRRDAMVTDRRIAQRARLWNDGGRLESELLSGPLLQRASERSGSGAVVDDGDSDYIEASVEAERARELRRRQRRARAVAMQSVLVREDDPSLLPSLALVAAELAACAESTSALMMAGEAGVGPRIVGADGTARVRCSPDGSTIAVSNSASHEVSVFTRHESGVEVKWVDHLEAVRGESIDLELMSASGVLLALAGGKLSAFDIDDGSAVELISGLRRSGETTRMAVSSDGRRVYVAGTETAVMCWHRTCNREWLRADDLEIVGSHVLATSSAANLLASGRRHGGIEVWRLDGDPSEQWRVATSPHVAIGSLAFSPDGRYLAAGLHDGMLRVFHLDPQSEIPAEVPVDCSFSTWVNAVAFSPSGHRLAAGSSDGRVELWDVASWERIEGALRHPCVVSAVSFIGDDAVATGAEDGVVRLWDVGHLNRRGPESIWSVGFVSGRRYLATSSGLEVGDDGVDPAEVWPAGRHAVDCSGACDSSEQLGLMAVGTRTGDVVLVGARQLDVISEAEPPLNDLVEFVRFCPTARRLAAVDRSGQVAVWDVDSAGVTALRLRVSVGPEAALCIDFIDPNTLVVTVADGTIHVLGIENGDVDRARRIASIESDSGFPIAVATHPVLPEFASAGSDRRVTLWDMSQPSSPSQKQRLLGPAGHVMSLAFDRTGQQLAAGATDGTAWIWRADADGRFSEHAHVRTGDDGVYAVSFSPDGLGLVTGGTRGRVRQWKVDTDQLVQDLRRRVGDGVATREAEHLLLFDNVHEA